MNNERCQVIFGLTNSQLDAEVERALSFCDANMAAMSVMSDCQELLEMILRSVDSLPNLDNSATGKIYFRAETIRHRLNFAKYLISLQPKGDG